MGKLKGRCVGSLGAISMNWCRGGSNSLAGLALARQLCREDILHIHLYLTLLVAMVLFRYDN